MKFIESNFAWHSERFGYLFFSALIILALNIWNLPQITFSTWAPSRKETR